MTKQELDELKLLTINDLIPLGIALERRGQWKSIRHWESDKWKFECVSDTEYFKTESIFEAVDWFYDDLKPDEEESKPESEVKFTTEAKPEITREDIEEAKREAQIEMVHRIKTYSLSVSFENAKNLNKTGNCFYDGKIEAYKDINEMCEALLYRLGEED